MQEHSPSPAVQGTEQGSALGLGFCSSEGPCRTQSTTANQQPVNISRKRLKHPQAGSKPGQGASVCLSWWERESLRPQETGGEIPYAARSSLKLKPAHSEARLENKHHNDNDNHRGLFYNAKKAGAYGVRALQDPSEYFKPQNERLFPCFLQAETFPLCPAPLRQLFQ